MGRYLIALLALTIALSLGLAYSQDNNSQNQDMQNQRTGQIGEGNASIMVDSQELTDGFVTVSNVTIDQPGWVVIHGVQDGRLGGVVGFARVDKETGDNIKVPVDANTSTETVVAELHYDRGSRGCFEFPGADVAVKVNGLPVMVPFTLTFSQELQQQVLEQQQRIRQMIQQMIGQNLTMEQEQMMNRTMEQNQTINQTINQTMNQTMDTVINESQTVG